MFKTQVIVTVEIDNNNEQQLTRCLYTPSFCIVCQVIISGIGDIIEFPITEESWTEVTAKVQALEAIARNIEDSSSNADKRQTVAE